MSVEEAVEVIRIAIDAVDSPDDFEKLKDAIEQLNLTWESWLENSPRED